LRPGPTWLGPGPDYAGRMSAVLPPPSRPPTGAAAGAAELLIVLNLRSGAQEKDAVRAAIEQVLLAAGRRFRFIPVQPGEILSACGEAAREAARHGGALVAVGGDGTLNAAAQAAHAADCPLGVIAQGTFNLFARELGLPLDAADAARALVDAREVKVQVGQVNQHLFLVNASVGLYPKLLEDREAAKHRLGRRRWIAAVAGLVTLLEWRLQLRLDAECDGVLTKIRTPSLFVGNNRTQLEAVGLDPELVAHVGRGWLAGVIARPLSFGAKLRLVWQALRGRLGAARDIDSLGLRSLVVFARGARRLKVSTDGEVQWMEQPLRFAVAPRPLRVLVPAAAGEAALP